MPQSFLAHKRAGRSSIMIVSQIPVANWYDLFQEATFADSFLDRICHKAYRLDFNGESLIKKIHKTELE
ncbi:ATP-binding protein [Erysipelotrichaceae bacterium 66-17]